MASKQDLADWVYNALVDMGGSGTIVAICKQIWNKHEKILRDSGDLFFTWQYDMRWAGTYLRKSGIMKSESNSPRGIWELQRPKN